MCRICSFNFHKMLGGEELPLDSSLLH
jgi:hypothetical protein